MKKHDTSHAFAPSYQHYITRLPTQGGLLLRLMPCYLYHWFWQPYRQDIVAIGYKVPKVLTQKRRHLTALYDAMYNLLLDGYEEIVPYQVREETGEMFFLFIELTRRIDEHLDQYIYSDTSLSLDTLLQTPLIQEQLTVFRNFLHLFDKAEVIMKYLNDLFAFHYDHYIKMLKKAQDTQQFNDVLASAEVDTGIWLRCVMEAVALFNDHQYRTEDLNAFYLFGMVGKFADDMIDLPRDVEKGTPNLLYALACQTEVEKERLLLALKVRKKLKAAWWKRYCPQTYQSYFSWIVFYYKQIASKKLIFASDLLMLPAVIGRDYDPERSAGHLKHDENAQK